MRLDRFSPALWHDPHYRASAVPVCCVIKYSGGVRPLPRYLKPDDDAGLCGWFHKRALVVPGHKIPQVAPIGAVLDPDAQLPDRFATLVADYDVDTGTLTHNHAEEIEKDQPDNGCKRPGHS
jgi:hypothetical protein